MTSFPGSEVQQTVWQVVLDINKAWVNGHVDDMVNLLHEDVVFFHPVSGPLGEGREACMKGYKDFADQAVIHDFKELEPSVDVYGSTAVAAYRFDITYEIGGGTGHDTGRDVIVLVREDSKWKAVWRTQIPFAEKRLGL